MDPFIRPPAKKSGEQVDGDPYKWIGIIVLEACEYDKQDTENEVKHFHDGPIFKNFFEKSSRKNITIVMTFLVLILSPPFRNIPQIFIANQLINTKCVRTTHSIF
jgi:hypothetical protein